MNILFIDQFSEPGGAQLCLTDLLPEVLARGWSARLMAPGEGELVRRCREFGIPHYSLPIGKYSNGRKTVFDLARFVCEVPRMTSAIRSAVESDRPDLVYVNGPRPLPAVEGAVKTIRCPVIFHAHNPVAGRWPREIAERSLRRMKAQVIAVSRFVAGRYPGARVVYNGVPDFSFPACSPGRLTFRDRAPRVGIVGRIAPQKGHLEFLQAARAVSEIFPDIRFLIHGERLFSDTRYDEEVRKAAANGPFEFCGWQRDVSAVMRNLDILVVPSDPTEAATRVIMEAFSAGTPVIAYRSGGIPELVDDGRNGVLVDWPNVDSLARGILSLLRDPRRMKRLAAAGRIEWENRFRIETFRRNVCDVIESVVRKKAALATSETHSTTSVPMRGCDAQRAWK